MIRKSIGSPIKNRILLHDQIIELEITNLHLIKQAIYFLLLS